MTDIAILLNPSAGGERASRKRARLEAILKQDGIHSRIFVSKTEDDLRSLTAQKSREFPVIVGAGGDGTIAGIVQVLQENNLNNTVGIIPFGSSNDIAREFGVNDLGKACAAIRNGKTKDVDLGVLTGNDRVSHYFLGTASLGLGVTVNKYVEEMAKRYPALPEMQNILGALGVYHSISSGKIPVPLELKNDNSSLLNHFFLIVFYNTRFYASGKLPNPDAKPNDGVLNCYCHTAIPLHDINEPLWQLDLFERFYLFWKKVSAIGNIRQPNPKDVKRIAAPEFKIVSGEGTEIQTDGKVLGPYRDITIYVKPKSLKLIVSPSYER